MEKELHTNESNNIDIHSTSLERKLSLALHKRYPVIWAADNIQELVLDDKATVENVYDVLAEIEDKCVHLSKLINIEFNPSNVQKLLVSLFMLWVYRFLDLKDDCLAIRTGILFLISMPFS